MSYDISHLTWNCPKCSYDLEALAEGRFVVCPECGRRWSVDWLRDRPDVPLPRLRWVLLPLVSLGLAIGVGAAELLSGHHPAWLWTLVWPVLCLWNVVCWTIALDRSARPRLGDMAAVIALFLAAGPAVLWTYFCIVLGQAFRGV